MFVGGEVVISMGDFLSAEKGMGDIRPLAVNGLCGVRLLISNSVLKSDDDESDSDS